MESTDLTVQILIDIRDQLAVTNQRLDTTNERLDAMSSSLGKRIDDLGHHLGKRIDQTNRQLITTETRLATEISALRGALVDDPSVLERLGRCERDIEELRQRLG